MIQRIQTIYLFINVLFYSILLFTPIANIGNEYIMNIWTLKDMNGATLSPTYYLGFMALLIIIISTIAIFSFKNRPSQNKLCVSLVIMIMFFIILLFFIYPDFLIKQFVSDATPMNFSLWTILSVIPLATSLLANKAILKDEKKIKESKRLR